MAYWEAPILCVGMMVGLTAQYFVVKAIRQNEDHFLFAIIYYFLRTLAGFCKLVKYNNSFENKFGIYILNMFLLDEIYLEAFEKSINSEIGYALTYYTDFMFLIWVYNHQSNIAFMLLAMFILIKFSLKILQVQKVYFASTYSIKQDLIKFKYFQNFLRAYVFGFIHLISFIMLIYLNWRFKSFAYFFIILTILLAKVYKSYNTKIKSQQIYLEKYIQIYFYHIIIDPRELIGNGKKLQHDYLKLFDRHVIFALIMKVYLLLMFAQHYNDNLYKYKEIQNICAISFIISIISTLHLVYKIVKNTIYESIFGSNYKQFNTINNFIQTSSYKSNWFSKNKNNNKQLQMIQILEDDNKSSKLDRLEFIELLFQNYNKSEIISPFGSRSNIDESQWQNIKLDFTQSIYLSINDLLQFIGEKQFAEEIESVFIDKCYNDEEKIKLYKKLSENNIGVLVKTKEESNQLSTINTNLFWNVKQICAQNKAFQMFLSQQQLINPFSIFYDLYEDL